MPLTVVLAGAVEDWVHGALSRWLVKVDSNLYIGSVTRRVSDELWRELSTDLNRGKLTMFRAVGRKQSEQEFEMLAHGRGRYVPVPCDGLTLIGIAYDYGTITTD